MTINGEKQLKLQDHFQTVTLEFYDKTGKAPANRGRGRMPSMASARKHKHLKWGIQFLLVFLCFTGFTSSQALELSTSDHEVLRQSPEILFGYQAPPNAFHNDNDEYVGLLVSFQKLIEEQLQDSFELRHFSTWEALINHAKTDSNFVIVGIAATPARSEYLQFTAPFVKTPYVIVTRRNSQLATMEALVGSKVCTVSNYAVNDFIAETHPSINPRSVADTLMGLRLTSSGECDATIVNQMYASYLIENQGITNLRIAGESGYLSELSAATSIKDPALFNLLQKAIDAIPEKKSRLLIHEWVSHPHSTMLHKPILLTLGVVIGTVVGMLGLSSLWSFSLRKQVRKQTREIRKARDKFEQTVQQAPIPMMSVDATQNIVLLNNKFTEFYGYTVAEISTMDQWWEKMCPDSDYRSRIRSIWEKALGVAVREQREMEAQEWQVTTSTDQTRCVEFKMTAMDDTTLIAMNDITDRKRAENALGDSNAFMRRILDTTPHYIYWKNTDLDYLGSNHKFATAAGLASPDHLKGKSDYNLPWQNHEAEAIRFSDQRVLRNGTPQLNFNHLQHHADGSVKSMSTSKFPLRNANGHITGILGFSEDVTEKQQTERTLRRVQKMDAIGQLTGGIAHDFNNILGIILGNVGLMEQQVKTDEKLLRRVDIIKKSAGRAADLTRQLLSVSRNKPAEVSVTNINQVTGNMQNLITHSLTPKIAVHQLYASDLWLTEIDPGDYEDALLNLVLNARDAMPDGGQLTLETTNKTLDKTYCQQNPGAIAGDYVQLAVSDTGSGISAEDQERIFEPFFTTKPIGKGTGLGMAMVYGFVKRSSGLIKVYSERGVGTTVLIFLPRSHNADLPEAETVQSIPNLPRGTETVLVVDDESGLVELAQNSLNELGYKVLTASNSHQALTVLEQHPDIKLIFSDVVMPGGINGYELAELAQKTNPQIKVLLTSGYTEKTVAHKRQIRFSSLLLNKPYTQAEMAQRIRIKLDSQPDQQPPTSPGKKAAFASLNFASRHSTGISEIDEDHRTMLKLLNQAGNAFADGEKTSSVGFLTEFHAFSADHFRREEAVMRICEYADLEKHIRVHKMLMNGLEKMLSQQKQGELKLADLLNIHSDWLNEHLKGTDHAYVNHCQGMSGLITETLKELDVETEMELP